MALEHYLRAAKELGLDVDKIYADCIKSALEAQAEKDKQEQQLTKRVKKRIAQAEKDRQEQLNRVREKMRREMK